MCAHTGRKNDTKRQHNKLSIHNYFDQANREHPCHRENNPSRRRDNTYFLFMTGGAYGKKKHHTKRQHNTLSIQNYFDQANRYHACCRKQSFMTSRQSLLPVDDSAHIGGETATPNDYTINLCSRTISIKRTENIDATANNPSRRRDNAHLLLMTVRAYGKKKHHTKRQHNQLSTENYFDQANR